MRPVARWQKQNAAQPAARDSTPATGEPEPAPDETGPTVFTARAVDGTGRPIEAATFLVVTEEGAPRPFGDGTASGVDGRVEITVESE